VAAPGGVRSFPAGGFDPEPHVPGLSRSARQVARRRAWRWALYRSRLLKPDSIPVALNALDSENPGCHPGFLRVELRGFEPLTP
jgi:hypothetical protein